MVTTWANNWNGVNHSQTAPDAFGNALALPGHAVAPRRYAPPEYDERSDKRPVQSATANCTAEPESITRAPTDIVARLDRLIRAMPAPVNRGDWEGAR